MKMIEKINAFFKTTHKAMIGLLAGTTALSSSPALPSAQAEETSPPNVILILADDLGWTDINCRQYDSNGDYIQNSAPTPGGEYDSMYYETPNIAKLRANGMRFTNAYACPSCKATRAGLMTGKYPQRCQPRWSKIALPLAETTIPEALDAGGTDYLSAHVGKWNLCNPDTVDLEHYYPDKQGFDYNYGGTWRAMPSSYWENVLNGWENDFPGLGDPCSSDPCEFLTDSLTTRALEFMESTTDPCSVNYNKPFFLNLAFHAPHLPVHSNLDSELYQDHFSNKSDPTKRHDKYDYIWDGGDSADYAALIKRMDYNIGRVLDKIDTLGIDNNTIIIFLSDNGGWARATDNSPLNKQTGKAYIASLQNEVVSVCRRWKKAHQHKNTYPYPQDF